MSQTQYDLLRSNLLKEKHALAKLRAELEGRQRKMYFECKKFRHLAYNCRNKREGEKRTLVSQNRFEALSSRVIRCGVEIRRQEENGRERVVQMAALPKMQPKEPACSIRRNAQENEIRCFECEGMGH